MKHLTPICVLLLLVSYNSLAISANLIGGFEVEVLNTNPGECNGVLEILADGSSGPFTLSLTFPNGDMINYESGSMWTIPDLCEGSYQAIFTNDFDCTFVYASPINIISCEIFFSEDDVEGSITNPSTCDSEDGFLFFRFGPPVTGGTSPYTVKLYYEGEEVVSSNSGLWSNLSSGIYLLKAVDAEGCTATYDVEILSEDFIEIDFSANHPCSNSNSGEIETIILSNSEYTVQWSNGSEQEDLEELPPGEYCITVTNGSGCTTNDCYNLSPISPEFELSAEIINSCRENNGSIAINIDGSLGPDSQIELRWEDDGSNRSYRENLPPGEYCVQATLCENTKRFCFEVGDETVVYPEIELTSEIVNSCPNPSPPSLGLGSISIDVTGGSGNFSYEWSNGVSDNNSITNLNSGLYCVTITDDDRCASDNVVVRCLRVEEESINIGLVSISHCDDGDCSGSSITVETISETENQFTYDWIGYLDNGETFTEFDASASFTGLESGRYCITSRPTNGTCSSEQSCFSIQNSCSDVPPLPSASSFEFAVWPVSNRFEFGAIFLVSAPGDNVSFQWVGPGGFTSSSPSLDPASGPGTYILTISNGCGESIERTFSIEQCSADLSIDVLQINDDCANDGYASVQYIINGLEPNNTYYGWNGVDWTPIISTDEDFIPSASQPRTSQISNGPGEYIILITTRDGCTAEATVTVEPGTLDIVDRPFYALTRVSESEWMPYRCDVAKYCGESLVDVIQGNPVEATVVAIPGQGCEIIYSCFDPDNELRFPGGNLVRKTIPDYGRKECVTGDICEVRDIMDNPIFAELTGQDSRRPFIIRADYPFSVSSVSRMRSEYDIINGRCIEQLYCEEEREPLLTLTFGGPTRTIECVYPGNNQNRFCQEVSRCYQGGLPVFTERGEDELPDDCCGPRVLWEGPNNTSSAQRTNNGNVSKYVDFSTTTLENYYVNDGNKFIEEEVDQYHSPSILPSYFEVNIYPNPTSDRFTIQITGTTTEKHGYDLSILDLNGSVISRSSIHSSIFEASLEGLPTGVYLVKVQSSEGTKTLKLIKND